MKYAHRRHLTPKIFIYCNGELAEPLYFQALKDYLKSTSIKVIYKRFTHTSPWELIGKVSAEKEGLKRQGKYYEKDGDQCWCVFDIDNYWKENPKAFHKALQDAQKNNIRLAWSNECFELWYLLHFQKLTSTIPRGDYETKLKAHFKKLDGKSYTKNDDVFLRLIKLQPIAIKNAKSIHVEGMIDNNPSTSIFLLIEEIVKICG